MHAASAGVWGKHSCCEKSMPVPCVGGIPGGPNLFWPPPYPVFPMAFSLLNIWGVVVAAIQTSGGKHFRYSLIIRFVK